MAAMTPAVAAQPLALGAPGTLFANKLLPIVRPASQARGERLGSFKCGGNEAPGVLGSRVLLSTPPKWDRTVDAGNIGDILLPP